MGNLNTWADHLDRQRGTATYAFSVAERGDYLLEVRPSGLTIVRRDWTPGDDAPVLKVELDNGAG